ncbi:MAG: GNAT family N-acetyltransferase [Pseudomonas sp.]|uniref:GNAT family N-acetyltransferase n=1 Tax=Pseudomonas sp. TaxID=306 RepID=UPI003D0D672E
MSMNAAQSLPDSPFSHVDVRSACSTDAPDLADLLQQLGKDEPRPDTALHLRDLPPHRVVLVAERNRRLVGTCTLNLIEHLAHNFARSAILEDVVVDQNARGLGIGQALISAAMERARSWGCYKVALSSALHREDAHRFYQRLGFKPHGISLALSLEN